MLSRLLTFTPTPIVVPSSIFGCGGWTIPHLRGEGCGASTRNGRAPGLSLDSVIESVDPRAEGSYLIPSVGRVVLFSLSPTFLHHRTTSTLSLFIVGHCDNTATAGYQRETTRPSPPCPRQVHHPMSRIKLGEERRRRPTKVSGGH